MLGAVCLSGLCLALTACGKTSAAEQQRAERYGLTATTATSSSQKVIHAIAGRATTSSSTSATAQTSSHSQQQASLTDSLSDNDWYVLAYLSEWGYSLDLAKTMLANKFIHDTNDVSSLQALTNQLVSRGS